MEESIDREFSPTPTRRFLILVLVWIVFFPMLIVWWHQSLPDVLTPQKGISLALVSTYHKIVSILLYSLGGVLSVLTYLQIRGGRRWIVWLVCAVAALEAFVTPGILAYMSAHVAATTP